jgi:hypothetical protein
LARIDRKRPKKGSNDDWAHPLDPDAKITKMKDGRTHVAHKAEHAVDLDTGAIVGVTVQDADEGDGSCANAASGSNGPFRPLNPQAVNLTRACGDPRGKRFSRPSDYSPIARFWR